MRRNAFALAVAVSLMVSAKALALDGKVAKVLPQFVDLQGRHALSPSLFERDAYQAKLRESPALRSGLAFRVKWSAHPADWNHVRLRLEMRGLQGSVSQSRLLEQPVRKPGWFGGWTTLVLDGDSYKTFGDMTAWRVTLWDDNVLLGEQKSFLW